MKLGIGSYTYTWAVGVPEYSVKGRKMSAVDLIYKAKELGVSTVQICDNIPLHELSQGELLEIKKAAESLKIELEIGTCDVEPEHLRNYLEIAEFFHARLLRVILNRKKGELTAAEASACIREIIPELEKKEIRLAIENHERHRTKELKEVVQNCNSKYVGICLDTVNSFGAGEGAEQVIEELSPYMACLHYKDFFIQRLDHRMGFSISGAPAGKGMLNSARLKTLLGRMDEDISVILELWTPYLGTVEDTIRQESQWALESVEFLKKWASNGISC